MPSEFMKVLPLDHRPEPSPDNLVGTHTLPSDQQSRPSTPSMEEQTWYLPENRPQGQAIELPLADKTDKLAKESA